MALSHGSLTHEPAGTEGSKAAGPMAETPGTLAPDCTEPSGAVSPDERRRRMREPVFGTVFTEHIVSIDYEMDRGWGPSRMQPLRAISVLPTTSCLHYGQLIFEAFKAYRQRDGSVNLFRPDANARRFNDSAARLAMPPLDTERFVAEANALVQRDRDWVSSIRGEALYLRPVMLATDPYLGMRPSRTYLFLIVAMPTAHYFVPGARPISVYVCNDYIRAARGGTGAAKCAGNYAACLVAQQEAKRHDCEQALFLDAGRRRYVEELAGMNVFFVFGNGGRGAMLATPPLNGSILPGITRDTLLELARDLGYETQEREISIDECREELREGRLTEVFGCGTATVVAPIGAIKFRDEVWPIGDGKVGPVTVRLRDTLLGVQYGDLPDRHGWMRFVPERP